VKNRRQLNVVAHAVRFWNLEQLEPRRLMSVAFDNGILTVNGTAGDDQIQVGQSDGRLIVYDNDGPLQFEGALTQLPSLSQIKGVRIRGGDGNDCLEIINLPATLLGGAGDDTLVGGAANDYLAGGAGEDLLFAQKPAGFGDLGHVTFGGRIVGPDTLCGEGQGDTLLGEGADDGFQGPPRDAMSLTIHNGVLRIRGILAGSHVKLSTYSSAGEVVIFSSVFDRTETLGWTGSTFASDVHAVELLGIAPDNVTIDDTFAALDIPIRYVPNSTQPTPPTPADTADITPVNDTSDANDTSPATQPAGTVIQATQFAEPQPAYGFDSIAADSLLKSQQQLWDT
jgi:Ca2+-binding RTX toxin-like protein